MSERKIEKTSSGNRQPGGSLSSAPVHSHNPTQNLHQHHRHHVHGVPKHSTKKFRTLANTSHHKIDTFLAKHHSGDFQGGDVVESAQYRQLPPPQKAPKRNFLMRTSSVPKFSVSGNKKGHSHETSPHKTDDYIVEGHGTPTPSEKVSRWHRDIFLMSPNGTVGPNSPISMGSSGQVLHPRECICDQCMAEYGTYKLYNQMMQERGGGEIIKEENYIAKKTTDNSLDQQLNRNDSAKDSHYICGKPEQALFSPSSSASSGTDSSLRIRKTRAGCTERRWFICVSLAMIFTVLVASAGIYFGYQFLRSHLPHTEAVFRGTFVVTGGDYLPEGVAEIGSYVHIEKARFYQHKLDLVFNASPLSQKYVHNEVFLLEGLPEEGGLAVNFNIHMDPGKGATSATEIDEILTLEILSSNITGSVLGDLTIDPESLEIQERSHVMPPTSVYQSPGLVFGDSAERTSPTSTAEGSLNPSSDPTIDDKMKRQCMPFQVDYCRQLPYNFTTFPNGMRHNNIEDAKYDIDRFREIVDSKCYSLSYEFLCQLLQPVCFQEKMVLPCRDFCFEFMESCAHVLPVELRDRIQCKALSTEADGPGACISKPGCVAEMRNLDQEKRVCDGVVDCPDFSDELYCPYCPEHHFHCGVGKMCIHKEKMCDGVVDCDNAADEKGCLSLAPHMDFASYVHQYYKSGYLVYQEGGEAGKVCVDHMNKTVPKADVGRVLNKLGESMCNTLEYRDLVSIEIMVDNEQEERDVRYVDMIGPMSDDKSFIDVPCESREVVHIECNNLECGRRPAHIKPESIARRVEGRSSALHGDWPWHVALYKNGLHVCDGTLMNERWIMTTASCFQGQGRSKWAAKFASVRLNSRAPWEQNRQIVGMVKSPVEGNSIVILKMDKPVIFSDFARPICLPSSDEFIHMGAACVTLAWNNKDQQLHVVHLEPAPREKCEEVSEVSPHTICTQEKSERSECNGEEVAGAPLMCQAEGEWHLVGVAAWRKGCSSIGQRPRIYDKVSPNSEWAQKTIRQLDIEDADRRRKKNDRKRGRTPKKTDENSETSSQRR